MPATLKHQKESTQAATVRARPVPIEDRPIIIGSDGSESAALAMSAGRMLADVTGAPVQVISVLEPVSALAPAPLLVGLPPDVDESRAADRLDEVREQRSAAGGDSSWSLEVKFGNPATSLTRLAKERSARLVLMGLNRHGTVDRVLGGDTVFDVIRMGETPVLVVSEMMPTAPDVIVIGVDFSPLSTRAAQLAAGLFRNATDIYLVHVTPSIDITIDGWHDLAYAKSAVSGFAELVHSLDGCKARIQTVELMGDRERELARFARGLNADLLVVGSYRRGLFRRLATGTMAARVLRAAPCPVLVVPEPAVAEPLLEAPNVRGPEGMASTLKEVTLRNAGRRAVVEIDNPAIGAQALAFDYCFLGADYDWHSNRGHIYLGEMADGGKRHVTHSIGAPTGVDVLQGTDGRDQVVRIADGAGQALVTFW